MTLKSFINATAAGAELDKRSMIKARLLAIVADKGNPLSSELARELKVTPASIQSHVEELVNRGLISKTPNETQGKRREKPLGITKAGRHALQKILNN